MESQNEKYQTFVNDKKKMFEQLAPLSKENNWQMSEEKDGVKIYSKLEEKSGLYYIRAEGTAKAPMKKISDILLNADRITEYDVTLELGKKVLDENKLYITYTLSKKPNLLVDKRDCIVLSSYWEEKGSVVFAGGTIEHTSYPPQDSPVRCEIPIWGWLLKEIDSNTTHLTYVVLVDPKGWVPKPVINSVSTDQAMNVKGVRDLAEGKKPEKKGWFG